MTDDLGPDARALLESARRGHDPHPTDKARVKKAVLASIAAASAGAASAAEAAPASATSSGILSSSLVKVGLAVGVAGVLGVSAVLLQPTDTPTDRPVPVVVTTEAPAPIPIAPKEAPTVLVEVEAPVAEREVVEPKERPEPRVPVKVRLAPTPEAAEAEVDVSTLAAEAKLLAEVRIALDAARYDDVLRQVDKHTTAYPTGLLREEALAARVVALCGLDRRDEADAARATLVAVNPRSAHLARIASACR